MKDILNLNNKKNTNYIFNKEKKINIKIIFLK